MRLFGSTFVRVSIPFALLAAVASCTDSSVQPANNRGGPFSSISSSITDAAAADAPTGAGGKAGGDAAVDASTNTHKDAAPTTGAGGSGTGDSGTGGSGAGGSSNDAQAAACSACEESMCETNDDPLITQSYATCFDSTGTAGDGRAKGTAKTTLCQAVLACVRSTGCDKRRAEDCYCGIGIDPVPCVSNGNPTGPCKTQIENGAESVDIGSVTSRFYQPAYASGAAMSLLRNCDKQTCMDDCYGTLSGAAGTSGSAGGAGTNGSTSAAGTNGSAGITGASGQTGSSGTSGGSGATGAGGNGGSAAGANGSGTAGAAGTASGAAGKVASDGTGEDSPVCRDCENVNCLDPTTEENWEMPCGNDTTPAAAGPAKGTPKNILCYNLLSCMRRNKCAEGDEPKGCYCGTATSIPCITGQANGPCIPEFAAASESTSSGDISTRFTDTAYAVGLATNLYRCSLDSCVTECSTPYVSAGSGGVSGGGAAGTTGGGGGGAVGSAGAAGAGGSAGAAGVVGSAGAGGVAGSAGAAGAGGGAGTGAAGAGGQDGGAGAAGAGGTTGAGGGLATNGEFDHDAAGWTTEYLAMTTWSSNDAASSPSSGSLAVENTNVANLDGNTTVAARQCLPATSGASYDVSSSVYLASGQGTGAAGVSLIFYASADCSGPQLSVSIPTPSSATDAWSMVGGTASAPGTAQSMAVRLIVVKPFQQVSLEARFDDVQVKPH
jgi:hypothetical protein